MTRLSYLALVPSLLAATAVAQVAPDMAAAIKKEGLENSHAMEILDELANGVGHRLTGSDNFTRACEYAKAEFESMGFEDVELEKWGTWPIVWNRGQWQGRVISPEPFDLQVATAAWTNGTPGNVRARVLPLP